MSILFVVLLLSAGVIVGIFTAALMGAASRSDENERAYWDGYRKGSSE